MSKFWQKKYISKYTGAEIDAAVAKAGDATKVAANPTLAGTESALTGIEIADTKYKVEQPINVVANPALAGTEAALEGLQVGNTKYKVGGGDVYEVIISHDLTDDTITSDKSYNDIVSAINGGAQLRFKIITSAGPVTITINTQDYSYWGNPYNQIQVYYISDTAGTLGATAYIITTTEVTANSISFS